MLVEDIMTPKEKAVTIDPMTSVRKALELMREKKIKSIIVEKNSPDGAYGLLTFKNILQSIVAEDGDIDLLNVFDIANIPAMCIPTKMNVSYAAKMMVKSSIKRLLVLENNELKGILTMTDVIETLMDEID
jgi:CBS domain containing-hemolysin-like protein